MSTIALVQFVISDIIMCFVAKEKQSAIQILQGFPKVENFLIKNNKKSVNLQISIAFFNNFFHLVTC